MQADLHVHSSHSINKIWGSACESDPEAIIKECIKKNIGAVAITDHDSVQGLTSGKKSAKKHGILFIPGIEVSTNNGHMLAYGVEELIPHNRTAEETIDLIHGAGGIAVASHPFNSMYALKSKIYSLKLDGIEVFNSRCGGNAKSLKAAEELGLGMTAGSDAHSLKEIGNSLTIFNKNIDSVDSALNAIKKGKTSWKGASTPYSDIFRASFNLLLSKFR
ncbi:MAG: PHP-associated domain-containing protein [archaeon]